jgi:hypothetical protein
MNNNILNFPNSPNTRGVANQGQVNPMQIIMNQFVNGMSPMAILNRMNGPQVNQAKSLIGGKSEDQLRQIAMNMAKQRGIDLNNLAQQMGINLPK